MFIIFYHDECRLLQRRMAETLEQGPIYFFDQPKSKRKWVKKKKRGEQLDVIISGYTNPQENRSFYRNPAYREERMEGGDASVKINTAKQIPVSPSCHPLVFQPTCEHHLDQLSQIPSHSLKEETLQLASLNEHKYISVTILRELEDMLRHFSKYKIILPQGILNILNYSWKDLVEDAWYNKKYCQEPTYKNLNTGIKLASEESCRLSPSSEYDDEMAVNTKRRSKQLIGVSTDVVKGSKNPVPLVNKPVVLQQGANDSLSTISFSLSSKLCQERGWFSQHYNSDTKDPEWKAPYVQAVERLQLAKIQITEQLAHLKESGFDKPVILRHYGSSKKDIFGNTFPKNIRRYIRKTVSSNILYEKPQLPAIKKNEPVLKKLHYGLIDGSSLIYYPSGHFAVCQSYSDLPNGGLYTNIFSDCPDCALLGTFTPFGHGSISFPNSNNIAMIFNQEGGMVTNKDGEMLRQWKWPAAGKLDDPVIIQVNKHITVRIAGRFAVSLIYKWEHETVNLSLSPVRGVAVPRLENLGKIFTEVRLLSKSIKAFTETHCRTLKEEEENKPLKKETSKGTKKTEENLNHMKDFNAMRELRLLQRKIKNIMEDWLEYFRIAFGISSPSIHKSSTFPQRCGRNCKPQFSAPAQSHLTQELPSLSSRAPQLLGSIFKTNQAVLSHLILKKKEHSESPSKSFYAACPVALRRTILGYETKTCRCSNYQIPYVTDLEYNHIINNQVSSPEQIIVVCVVASLGTAYNPVTDEHLDWLYERRNKNRSMPCTQGRLDSFRLLKYDINSADECTGHGGSLLVKTHNVGPGMFLMYIQGKLLFANYIFNGYSKSVKDLQKQIVLTRNNYNRCYYLPADYKFSSIENSLQTDSENTQGRISEDTSRCF
ncbi:uncharacterized protein C3orf20 isoform X3 [Anolis carolinensis]|uniref:uncharacterized protein C3orf20 isoform X3 n=1 Tax=Anolis carolinensis TaxID=28377 RepID=UPI002F2B261A